jgi:hypothetical protein
MASRLVQSLPYAVLLIHGDILKKIGLFQQTKLEQETRIYTTSAVVRFEFSPLAGASRFTKERQKKIQTACYVKMDK